MKRVYIACVMGVLLAAGCKNDGAAKAENKAEDKSESVKKAAADHGHGHEADDKHGHKAGDKHGHKAGDKHAKPTASGEPAKAMAKGPFPESKDPVLLDPNKLKHTAPKSFAIKFETTAGDLMFQCHRDWAPHGADRLYGLAKIGFYNDVSLFRAVRGFVIQFGIHGNPAVAAKWRNARLDVDPVKETNKKGTLTFAMAGSPTTRTTQVFINLKDNKRLDGMGFSPVCELSSGESTLEKVYMDYGGKPSSQQGAIQSKGNAFLRNRYPKLDYIKTVSLVEKK